MLRPTMQVKPSQRGFTMIELMIALVVGLIVSGAAVALVAAIGKSNADTVRATRLTQELRATAEVIARDMRRARTDVDPLANVSTDATTMLTTCNTITISGTAPSQCVQYAYDCVADPTTNAFQSATFNAIGLVGNKVYLKQTTGAAAACPTAADQVISSNTVNISSLTFTPVTGTSDAYTIKLAGQLSYQPGVTNSVTITNPTRTFSQDVRIRSSQVQ